MNAPILPRPTPPPISGNVFARYWRGGFSLVISYWVIGLLLNATSIALSIVILITMQKRTYSPEAVALSIFGLWGGLSAVLVFQSVGLWRSASRYAAMHPDWRRIWAVLARVSAAVSVASFVFQFVAVGTHQLDESWRMAFQNDPDIPDYTMRLMRGGTEMEIAGGFKYGLSRDVAQLMAAKPHLKVVHLNSVGGRIGEAHQLADLIRQHSLVTYTATSCLSACTLAFVAGQERFLKSGGKLGFHRAGFAGAESPDAMRSLLLEAGLEPGFVERAAAQPTSGMWYPTPAELVAAHVLTRIVDDRRFAASGFGANPGLILFETDLRRDGVYRAISSIDPNLFQSLAEQYRRGYIEGRSEGEIRDRLQAAVVPVIRTHIAAADDSILVGFANLLADEYTALSGNNASACFRLITRGETSDIADLFDVELRERERSLSERALRSRNKRQPAQSDLVQADLQLVVKRLGAQFAPEDIEMFNHPARVPPDKYGTYCRMTAQLFRGIAALPPPRAGDIMSAQFKSMSAAH